MEYISRNLLASLVFVFLLLRNAAPEMFHSIANMKQLYLAEREITGDLELYAKQEQEKVNTIKARIEELKARRWGSRGDIAQVVGHPINAFNAIREWWNPVNPIPAGTDLPRRKLTERHIAVPGEGDYNSAVQVLLHLQKVYKLPLDALVEGYVHGVEANKPLEEFDYWAIGYRAYLLGEYGLAILWLEMVAEKQPRFVPVSQVFELLAFSYSKIGNYEKAAAMAMKMHESNPGNIDLESKKDYFVAERDVKIAQGHRTKHTVFSWRRKEEEPWRREYEALCRGPSTKNVIYGVCRYKQGLLPWVTYKEEILSDVPFITVYHDVITDKQIQLLKDAANVASPRGNQSPAEQRVSKLSWVFDQIEGVRALSAKIEDITGLSTAQGSRRHRLPSAEPFQVVNYGVGGHNEPGDHMTENPRELDQPLTQFSESGDRLGTFMFYLEDTDAGGATVFPQVGARIPPTKGAAVFWYEKSRSGSPERFTLPADCPVLLGQKWVATKWIREYGQEFRRKCCPNHDATELEGEMACG